MKCRSFIVLFIFIGPFSAAAESFTLDRCFELALARSTTVANQLELVTQAEEHIVQSRSGFFPNLSGSYQYLRQASPSSSLAGQFAPNHQETFALTLNQNLFRGFKDFAYLKQKGFQKDYYEYEKYQATVQLFSDTAQSFFNAMAYQHDLKNYRDEIKSNEDREKQLVQSRKLLRARDSDIVSIEASIANLEASISSTKGLLNSELETLSFLTGVDLDDLSLVDDNPLPESAQKLEVWLAQLDKRPDVLAAKSDIDAAKEAVVVNRSGLLPSVDLQGHYYPERQGIYEGVNWDASLSITVPFFDGGLSRSQTREAKSQVVVKDIALEQARRQAREQIRSQYRTFEAALDQIQKFRIAARLSKRSYELYVKDNRAGFVTNIEVLTSLATASQNQRSLDRAIDLAKYNLQQLYVISAQKLLKDRTVPYAAEGNLK